MNELRALPSVDETLARLSGLSERYPRALIVDEIRRRLEEARAAIRAGGAAPWESLEDAVERGLERLSRPSLRRAINATGVVLHTNLGRAPLPRFDPVFGYSNLEYDLEAGRRGKRDAHIAELIERLLGRPGIAVNNNAAAVYLTLREIAGDGEAIVSRGELIEIGDGFRIPEIMAESGAALREVGTTNRTRIEDYRAAMNANTRLLLRVHPSNFRMTGFTERPSLEALAGLARETGVPLYEDLGGGCVADLSGQGIEEPSPAASLRAGADLVSFSGDKLLGGPQAGILAGRPDLIERLRRRPVYRALRLDKLILQALETTLRAAVLERWDELPAVRMIRMTAEEVRERAERVAAVIEGAEVTAGESVVGGGTAPEQTLPTWLVAIRGEGLTGIERRLREGNPPVIARIEQDRLLLDLRTVFPEEDGALTVAARRAVRGARGLE